MHHSGFVGTDVFSLPIDDVHLAPVSPESPQQQNESQSNVPVELTIISRRSIYRAGTRYIKRGIDEDGHCANTVETEQILSVAGHTLSFLQLRASIPIFWSQPGYKYRPPPIVDRPKSESFPTFQKHFAELFEFYSKRVIVLNLVEQMGKERVSRRQVMG